MNKNDKNDGCGTFLFISGLTMIILKLFGVLHLSWWIVTLPFWIVPAILFLPLAVTIALCGAIICAVLLILFWVTKGGF